ncbi:MAG: DNA polymerase III subunit delta [Saprospiraceae bacterium]
MVFKDSTSLIKKIKTGQLGSIYLLHGEEGFYIDQVTEYLENNILNEGEKAFNQQVIYGKDAHVDTVIDYALQYPMMSERRVLIVKEAQGMDVKGIDSDSKKFLAYIKKPSPTTLLVISHKNKKVDGRYKWAKLIKDHHDVLESNRIKDYQLKSWIEKYLKAKGHGVENKVTDLVAEYLGTDLSKVSNELNKLIVNLKDGQKISLKEVDEYIGISKDYNVFELQEALITKNSEKVGRIVSNFQANMKRQPMEMVVGSLFSFYQRLFIVHQNLKENDGFLTKNAGINPYFLQKTKEQARSLSTQGFYYVFKIISDYDARTKGYRNRSTTREELLKEMVGKLMMVK